MDEKKYIIAMRVVNIAYVKIRSFDNLICKIYTIGE